MDQSLYDTLLEYGLTPDAIDQVLALGESQTEGNILGRQMRMAEGLQFTPGARGRRAGRVYRAASPWEHAGTLATRLAGMYGGRGVEDQQRALARSQTEARGQLLRALGRRRQGVTAPGASSFGPPEPAVPKPYDRPMVANPREDWTPYYG